MTGTWAHCRWPALPLILVAGILCPCQAEMRCEASARLSSGYDSNALEAVSASRRVGDSFIRLESDVALSSTGRQGGGPRLEARTAVERFLEQRGENRRLAELTVGWRQVQRDRRLSCRWSTGHTTRPGADSLDVWRHELSHEGSITLAHGTDLRWSAQGRWAETRPSGPSDRRGWGLSAGLGRRVGARWRLSARLDVDDVTFDERAILSWTGGEIAYRDGEHHDRSLLAGIGATWLGQPMLTAFYGYRRVSSNSFGFAQHREELSFAAAFLFPYRISAQLIGRLQTPHYAEEGFAVYRLTDDPEAIDVGARSRLTLQLRRPLGDAGFSAEIRGSWHRNESRISGRYHEKVRLTAGISYQASNAESL